MAKSKSKSKNNADRNLSIRGGVYYITGQRTVNGKTERLSRSTGIRVGEPDARTARRDARRMRDWMLEEWRLERLNAIEGVRLRDDTPRLPKLCDEYLRIVKRRGSPRYKTARNNVSSLRTICRAVGADFDTTSVNFLNRQLVIEYTEKMLNEAKDVQTTQITVNSTLRQAKSIFKRSMLGEYPEWLLPQDLIGFTSQFACVNPMTGKAREDTPPSKNEMKFLVKKSGDIKGTPLFPVWLLNYYLGMRVSEIEHCRWSWFDEDEFGRRCINIKSRPEEGYEPKGRRRVIPIADDVWEMIDGCRSDDSEFLVPAGSKTARFRITHRDYNKWIDAVGWNRRKKSHAIRAHRIEQWRRKHGDSVARDWGGHISLRTTLDHYAGNVHAEAPMGAAE